MVGSEIRSVEISFFVHATEDEERLIEAASSLFSILEPEVGVLKGHFGNRVSYIRYRVKGVEASSLFSRIASMLSGEDVKKILDNTVNSIDEDGALYLRFSKQDLLALKLVLAESDPVRVKVKPRGYLRGDPAAVYASLLGRF